MTKTSLKKYNDITEAEIEQVDLVELLLNRQAELNTLLEITQAINRNVSSSVLIEMMELILKNSLEINKFLLLIKEKEQVKCISFFGEELKTEQEYQEVLSQVCDVKIPLDLTSYENALLSKYNYFIPVYHKDQPLAYVFVGNLKSEGRIIIKTKLNYIQTLINVIIVAFENKKLFKERIQKERLQRELELAGEVQNMLIPGVLPNNPNLELDAIYLPHQNIGGDFYDFIKLSDGDFLWCIADVSGKGISAALIMANFQASLRALASSDLCLKELIVKLNELVFKNTEGERFITVFLGKFNARTNKVEYINAGHVAPLLMRGTDIIPLEKGCMMIGVFDELPFINIGEVEVEPGSIVFNYTDGIIEYDGDEEKTISEKHLVDMVSKNKKNSLKDLHKNLMNSISEIHQGQEAKDDITMLSIRFL